MFKKSLLALTIASASFVATAAVTPSAIVNSGAIGVDERGSIGDNFDGSNDGSYVVSAQGAQGATLFDLSDVDADTTVTVAGVMTYTITDSASVLSTYATLDKIRITLTGGSFNPATDLSAAVVDLAGTAADFTFADEDAEYPAANVLELSFESGTAAYDGSNIAAGDTFTLGGLVIAPDSLASGSTVTAKVEMISNVGEQVIDSASTVLTHVRSNVSAYTYWAIDFDGTIDVTDDRMSFVGTPSNSLSDSGSFYVVQNEVNLLQANLSDSAPIVTAKGDFAFLDADGDGELDDKTSIQVAGDDAELNEALSEATYEAAALAWDHEGGTQAYTFVVTTDGEREIPVQSFLLDASFSYRDAKGTAHSVEIEDAYFGAWGLNGTNVNVPYLPVGFGSLSANVEVANASNIDADISISGFDQNGVEYGPVKLDKQAMADTVTKVSENDIVEAFGLTEGTKLSFTITVNSPTGISVYPYYRENDVRVSLPTSQYRAVQCVASGTISTQAVDVSAATWADAADGAAVTAAYGDTSGTVSTQCTRDFN